MNYKTVIGLEIHVQLKTKSKMFCGCDNNAENAAPNTLVCPVCMGMPGVLPVANEQAIEWTLKTGLALNCKLAQFSRFDRKHYFYPDLPKNYQISQYDLPFCQNGYLEIKNGDSNKKIKIRRIHLEEDAGKLIHAGDSSLVDLNRAGTPLMEVVTEPEISTPAEAKIFMQELRSILRYLDVSSADMEKGHLRCDANISITQIQNANLKTCLPTGKMQNDNLEFKNLGIPVEIKNLNSFRMVERALLFEEKRQKELLAKGEKVIKETRGWNDARGKSYSQRSKEIAQDYRYFPEPDVPPFEQESFEIEKIKKEIKELPAEKRLKYIQNLGLNSQDAAILATEPHMAEYFEKVAQKVLPKLAVNWIINELKIDGTMVVAPENLIELLIMLERGQISGKIAKEILKDMRTSNKNASEIIKEKNIQQIGDEEEIIKVIDKVLKENSEAISDFQKGKTAALGFLVGKVMQMTKGQANPQVANKILKEKLARQR